MQVNLGYSGIEIEESQIGNFPCFYVLQLMRGRTPFAIKIGKTNVLVQRLKDYSRYYGGPQYYKILYLRKFNRKHGHGIGDVVQGSHYAGSFERHVIRKLKDLDVPPLYSADFKSDEYYHYKDKDRILSAVYKLSDELKKKDIDPVPNRRSKRIAAATTTVGPTGSPSVVTRSMAKPKDKYADYTEEQKRNKLSSWIGEHYTTYK